MGERGDTGNTESHHFTSKGANQVSSSWNHSAACTSLVSAHISLFLCLAGHWLHSDLDQSGQCPETFTGGNNTIVLPYSPLTTLTGMQKGRAGRCLCRNLHTNTGIPASFFSLCYIRLGGFLASLNPTDSSLNL